jgi:hypothetical protein
MKQTRGKAAAGTHSVVRDLIKVTPDDAGRGMAGRHYLL